MQRCCCLDTKHCSTVRLPYIDCKRITQIARALWMSGAAGSWFNAAGCLLVFAAAATPADTQGAALTACMSRKAMPIGQSTFLCM